MRQGSLDKAASPRKSFNAFSFMDIANPKMLGASASTCALTTARCNDLLASKEVVQLRGRVRSVRSHSETTFADVQDHSGVFQILIEVSGIEKPKCGDLVAVLGSVELTRKGTFCLNVRELSVIVSCGHLDNAPKDVAKLDYRRASVCRSANISYAPKMAQRLLFRARLIQKIRLVLWASDFLEVDTPLLDSTSGTTRAHPFSTISRALGRELYLRRTSELWLKQVVAAGFERVFEVGRQFRNEGVSNLHAPEFMQCEIYATGWTYLQMIELVSLLLSKVCELDSGDGVLDEQFLAACRQPLAILDFAEACEIEGPSSEAIGERWRTYIKEAAYSESRIAVILHSPTLLNPLAKRVASKEWLVEDFRFFWKGIDLGHGCSELTNAVEQECAMQAQLEDISTERNAQIDVNFIKALRFGLPSCAGLAFAIDRIVMAASGMKSLHDCHWFPQF